VLILKNGARGAEWLSEHIGHPPGIKVTAKISRCLGCGSRLRERLEVERVDDPPLVTMASMHEYFRAPVLPMMM